MYPLLPGRPKPCAHEPFVTWPDAFSSEEIDKINTYVQENCNFESASVSGNENRPDMRKSKVAWISPNNITIWIYDRLAYIARSINSDFYNFDLYGMVEHLQYTVYEDNDAGFYTWHMDAGGNSEIPRKLSLVIQLSSPEEYQGGDLEINTGAGSLFVEKRKGMCAAFPAYVLHRVTPVTKGTRRSLVVWIGGPAFK